ncbi:MAG: hypothetical protein QXK21_01490, partial [Candidatus Micrarchaeia archaeon]
MDLNIGKDINREPKSNNSKPATYSPIHTPSLPHQHMTSVLNESTTLSPEAMKAYVEHLASLIAQLEMKEKEEREKEKETSDTDLKERIEEKEEIKEKEHEKFIEEIENKEREREEIQERIEEEAARIIEKNLDEEEVIKERLEAEILAVQESGLLDLAETIKEYSEKERLEELK